MRGRRGSDHDDFICGHQPCCWDRARSAVQDSHSHDPQPSVEWYRYARHITHVTSIATWWPGKYAPTQISHFVSARRTPPALDLNLRRGKWLRSVDTFC